MSKVKAKAAAKETSAAPGAPAASAARCRHFGECGGCQLQDLPYETQLERKSQALDALFEPAGWKTPIEVKPSPEPWYYRNKMEFSFQDVYPVPPEGEDHLLLGLKRRQRWDKVMNLAECHLMSPETPALLDAVHAWARKEKLEPYNLHRQVGFLRHLVVREGKCTGDRMVLLVTGPGELPKESFVTAVRSHYPATTILWGINRKKSDVAKSDELEVLSGTGTIHESVLGRKFRISPHSFFQTNTRAAERLYARIREWLSELKPTNLLDLYCGSGGISLCVADRCQFVLGIEEIASAVDDARLNAADNGVQNTQFMQAKVEDLLPMLASKDPQADVVILDPPRSGLHPSALKTLKQACPPWIVYVSCNPKAMAEDVKRFADCYELQRLEAFDLFPHTEHVEALGLLRSVY